MVILLPAWIGSDGARLDGAISSRADPGHFHDPPSDPRLGPLDRRHLAVVINQADPLSIAIGSEYAARRRIPAAQLIRIRFPPAPQLSPARFRAIRQQVIRRTPAHVQVYALAWATPYRVGCLSITTAFAFGYDTRHCAEGCRFTRINPFFANGSVRRPWDALGIRPTMLLAAASPDQARRLIGRGLAADGTRPPGTAYLLSSSDPARNGRALGYDRARAAVGEGFRVQILKADALRNARDVMFYFTGLATVQELNSNRFRPGAVADHLTSYGGQLTPGGEPTEAGQMSALRWLEAGATGSYGTVVEPCSIPAKFPDPALLMLFYRRGDTLIEAYWRSVAMPGQGVFIGEPLARPWRR
ncbi:TIGR03790 family protein [Synechococcus sp. CS-1324]|nr:TIGR03790 family protein [Synechococcus sp. CS-1324]